MKIRNTKQVFPRNKNTIGFTVVELLIVVVVIAILASITIVSFSGIQSKARTAALLNDLNTAAKQIKIDQAITEVYPASLAAINNGQGLKTSGSTTYQYSIDYNGVPSTFCLTATKGSESYFVSQDGIPTSGACAGHSNGGAPIPAVIATRDGYIECSSLLSSCPVTPGAIPTGSWMVAVVVWNDTGATTSATTPAGWTKIVNQARLGTRSAAVFAKQRDASENASTSYSVTLSNNQSHRIAIMWGTGGDSVGNWQVGVTTYRNTIVPTTSSNNLAASITTAKDKTLVLVISAEATSTAESAIVSISGATEWFYGSQGAGGAPTVIETIEIGYINKTVAGVTGDVTIVYPNTQTNNGWAVQIGIPPAI